MVKTDSSKPYQPDAAQVRIDQKLTLLFLFVCFFKLFSDFVINRILFSIDIQTRRVYVKEELSKEDLDKMVKPIFQAVILYYSLMKQE